MDGSLCPDGRAARRGGRRPTPGRTRPPGRGAAVLRGPDGHPDVTAREGIMYRYGLPLGSFLRLLALVAAYISLSP